MKKKGEERKQKVIVKTATMETGPLFYMVIRGTWRSSHLQVKGSTFISELFNPFAPEPPVTARADPRPFYPLWGHQF